MKIALVGRMRSGKDTVADLIDAHLEMCYPEYTDVQRIAFGDKMKQLFSLAHGRPFNKKTDRRLIQNFGQGARHMLGDDVWIKPVEYQLEKRDGNHQVTIVTDARQQNEILAMKAKGAHLIFIDTTLEAQLQRMETKGESISPLELGHSTEDVGRFRDHCDYYIYNGKDTSLAELLTQVEDIVSDIIDTRGD